MAKYYGVFTIQYKYNTIALQETESKGKSPSE